MKKQSYSNRRKAVEKGFEFIEKNCENGFYCCYISNSREMIDSKLSPREIGSSLLVLRTALRERRNADVTRKTLNYCKTKLYMGQFTFFENNSLPFDTDVSSWALSTLLEMGEISRDAVSKTVDETISNVNNNGIIQIYFEPCDKENRIDHVGIGNALYLINLFDRGTEASKSEDYIFEILRNRAYLEGAYYYHSPDTFLYILSSLVEKFPYFNKRFGKLLKNEIQNRIDKTKWPLDLAMRVSSAKRVQINNETDEKELLNLQKEDGSWPADAIYHYGRKVGYFGSSVITTAFAIEALK
jgi:hypothetical protein